MFKQLRLMNDLTQAEVAAAIGRTPNFVLKAEQLTFPSAPAPLVQYWVNTGGYEADFLKDWYRSEQTNTREEWLSEWVPHINPIATWRENWRTLNKEQVLDDPVVPTEYALSKGLCLPAAVVFNAEQNHYSSIMVECMDQLIDYVASGRYSLLSEDPTRVHKDLVVLRRRVANGKH